MPLPFYFSCSCSSSEDLSIPISQEEDLTKSAFDKLEKLMLFLIPGSEDQKIAAPNRENADGRKINQCSRRCGKKHH